MSEEKPCRHEYVKIYQRKLKGLERRMVATKAYLPVGFKVNDLGHLGEGSFCFCTKCRARLYPKRTKNDKLLARQALANQAVSLDTGEVALPEVELPIDVDELVAESADMQDIHGEGVRLNEEEQPCELLNDEDI
jgi:hypothetical protein